MKAMMNTRVNRWTTPFRATGHCHEQTACGAVKPLGHISYGFIFLLMLGTLGGNGQAIAQIRPGGGPGSFAPGFPQPCQPPAQPGPARPWEASIDVSTYSSANVLNRNLHTAIPIIGWGGLGPDVQMNLYHNSSNVAETTSRTIGAGFDMGEGWTIEFGDVLHFQNGICNPFTCAPTTATIYAEDGTTDTFVKNGAVWDPPLGVYDVLTKSGSTFTLTHKDQSYKIFESVTGVGAYRWLAAVGDAVGNEITIQRTALLPLRITSITDAACRTFDFAYDGNNRLASISNTITQPGQTDIPRSWTLSYDANDRLSLITDAEGFEIAIGNYDTAGRITSITDKRFNQSDCCYDHPGFGCDDSACEALVCDESFGIPECCAGPDPDHWSALCVAEADSLCGTVCQTLPWRPQENEPEHTYTYSYNNLFDQNGILTVADPSPGYLVQRFNTPACATSFVDTTYTDRRGQIRKYRSWRYNLLIYPNNGPMLWSETPLGHRTNFEMDLNRNLLATVDAELKRTEHTYDADGNMLTTSVDPLGLNLTQIWAYDAVNNVTSYTDGEGNPTTFEYDATYPTLLTKIIEPPVVSGGPTAETLLTYHTTEGVITCPPPAGDHRFGELKQVTDPNGVITKFDYDQWGQMDFYAEGEDITGADVYWVDVSNDSGGRTTSSGANCSAGSSSQQSMQFAITESGQAAQAGGGSSSYSKTNRKVSSSCDLLRRGATSSSTIKTAVQGKSSNLAAAELSSSLQAAMTVPFPVLPSESPELAVINGYVNSGGLVYSGLGNLTYQQTQLDGIGVNWLNDETRERTIAYNELNQITSNGVYSTDRFPRDARNFTFDHDLALGNVTRGGPDAVETLIQRNIDDRVSTVRRGPAADPLLDAIYNYYDNGLVMDIQYGNYAMSVFEYDAANRLTKIEHFDSGYVLILSYDYIYHDNNEIEFITETNPVGGTTVSFFGHDARGRLIGESRIGSDEYVVTYAYDAGGNRTTKSSRTGDFPDFEDTRVDYVYDTSDPATYGSANNRLMSYKTWDTSGAQDVQLSETYYYYNCSGNPTNAVTKKIVPGAGSEFSGTRLYYANNQQAVTFVLGEQWNDAVNPTDYQLNYAREFRYDGARARYLNRKLDPVELTMWADPVYVSLSETWSDYHGHEIYGDFDPAGASFIEEASYQPGIGRILDLAGTPTTGYYHANAIGTTGTVTDSLGLHTGFRTNTAFGEPIAGTSDRFGYAGSWGYQNTLSAGSPLFPFQHVGARYYDPATGRFLQRDPIGIQGGMNVYAYVDGAPTGLIDPLGLGETPPIVGKPQPPKPPTPDDDDSVPYDPHGCIGIAAACVVVCSATGPYGVACVTFCVATLVLPNPSFK